MKNKVISDTAFNFIEFIVTLLIYLITTKLLVSTLGIDGYGFYMFFSSLISTFVLLDVGMGMVVSKYCSEYIHKKHYDSCNEVISAAFFFYTLVITLTILAVIITAQPLLNFFNFDHSFRENGHKALIITASTFAISLYLTLPLNILIAYEKWKQIVLCNITTKIIAALILVLTLDSNYDKSAKVIISIFILFIATFIRFGIYIFLAKRAYTEFRFLKPSNTIKNQIIMFLKWSSLQYALSSAVGHFDKIIISRYFGLETLGIYSFVLNAFSYLYGLLSAIFKIAFPKLSKLHGAGNKKQLNILAVRLINIILITSLVISVVTLAVWTPFISYYIDASFASSSFWYFAIFSVYLFIRSPEIIISYFFNATAKPSALVANVAVGSIVTLIAYFLLVPSFEAYGLIFAQIAGTIAIYAFLWLRYKAT